MEYVASTSSNEPTQSPVVDNNDDVQTSQRIIFIFVDIKI